MSIIDVILVHEVSDMEFCESAANSYDQQLKWQYIHQIVSHMSIKSAVSNKHITAIWILDSQAD